MTHLIKTMDQDGLCNRLFSFAHLAAFALEHGHTLEHHSFQPYAQYFEGTSGRKCPRIGSSDGKSLRPAFPGPIQTIRDRFAVSWGKINRRLGRHRCHYIQSGESVDLSDPGNVEAIAICSTVQIAGFYHPANSAVDRHRDTILNYFSPREYFRSKIGEHWRNKQLEGRCVVGVHIRHGDYATHANGAMWYSEAEYAELIEYLRILFKGHSPRFLVATNGSFSKSLFDRDDVVFAPGHELLDLYCLAKCNYIVGPDSTYTEWASFVGKVPRYVHRRKPIEAAGGTWVPPELNDFAVHDDGYGRCAVNHPGYRSLTWSILANEAHHAPA